MRQPLGCWERVFTLWERVFTLEEQMAQREQIVYLHNKTNQRLTLDEAILDHGDWWSDSPPDVSWSGATWSDSPPPVIEAGTTVGWGSQSGGVATGTEGRVTYQIPLGDEK